MRCCTEHRSNWTIFWFIYKLQGKSKKENGRKGMVRAVAERNYNYPLFSFQCNPIYDTYEICFIYFKKCRIVCFNYNKITTILWQYFLFAAFLSNTYVLYYFTQTLSYKAEVLCTLTIGKMSFIKYHEATIE